MASLNKVLLIGRLGRDPELRYIGDGIAKCSFSLATSERYKDRSGEQQEKTEWHNIVLWRRQAEVAQEYLKKGSQVFIEGSIETRSWTDAENNKHYRTEIRVMRFQFLDRKGDAPSSAPVEGPGVSSDTASDPDDEELGPPLDYGDNILNPSG